MLLGTLVSLVTIPLFIAVETRVLSCLSSVVALVLSNVLALHSRLASWTRAVQTARLPTELQTQLQQSVQLKFKVCASSACSCYCAELSV